jgi:hypothetical protein
MRISEKGLRDLRSGTIDAEGEDVEGLVLIVEIAARVESIPEKNLERLFYELLGKYGSEKAAVEALRCGKIRIEKVD